MRIKRGMPDWVVGVIVTAFFVFITITGILDFTDAVEKKTFDLRAKLAASSDRNPDIEIVAITEDDILELGRFPWPRDIIAEAVRNISQAGARVIAMNIIFSEAEQSEGLETVKELREKFETYGLAQQGPGLDFYRDLAGAEVRLDKDLQLYNAMIAAGNVVLPVSFDTTRGGRDQGPPEFMERFSFRNVQGTNDPWGLSSTIWLDRVTPLLPVFAEAAYGIGHLNLFADSDGAVRDQVHVIGYLGKTFFPSFPMAIVKAFIGLQSEDIAVTLGRGIRIRTSPSDFVSIPVRDQQMSTLINWSQGPEVAFRHTPFSSVFRNEIRTPQFQEKIVIIGPTTAQGIGERFVTPIHAQIPGVEVVANAVSNILNQRFYSRPGWIGFAEFGVLLLFGLFLTAVLPRLRAGTGAFTTLALLLGYTGTGIAIFYSRHIWLYITPAAMLLITGYILVVSKRFFITERTKDKVEADSVETNKMLGLSFQQQGMLDLALEKFRKLPLEEDSSKDLLYNLGLDFERKRQFSKALSTYRLIVSGGGNFRDLDERIPRLKGAEATMIFGTGGGHPGDIGATISGMDTKPTLGRYEVTEELGRGAMGVVYKGEDPKIHRTVAIKTVRISDFDEDMVDEMKERFFREAESAGLLTHPNIVTIYDAGDEHDLAYIAMEFLEGEDLEGVVKKGNLLPVHLALHLTAQVADALNYAHERGIVHRDVKPANIMRLRGTDTVKVTDFGIARITSSSKTKTGVVLGTPSYMSPEQVAGKKVDGRSDIFSLGVVLFEMLTGQKPFRGEDITSLMYQIAREPHPSPRSINPRIPPVVEKIIDKALEKDAEKRYQKAGLMSEHLRKVAAKMMELMAKKKDGLE